MQSAPYKRRSLKKVWLGYVAQTLHNGRKRRTQTERQYRTPSAILAFITFQKMKMQVGIVK